LSACQLASVAVPTRDVKPVLMNLKAVADKNRCTLMATDLELGIRLEVRGLQVDEPGEALLPARRMLDILREVPEEDLTIEADASACVVRGRASEFEMPSEDPANFPALPTFADDKYHELTAGVLRDLIRHTVFAAADKDTRYTMTGVLWELEADKARLVATDGHRLALAEAPATAHKGHATAGQTPVVPTKAMNLLERNLLDDEEPVRVCIRTNEVLFRTERAVIYSRLVEGRFPDYRLVFPKKQASRVNLEVPTFLSAVRQAKIMTDNDSRRVGFHFAKGRLVLKAQGASAGRSQVELDVDYDGKPVDINFNPEYLVDMLGRLQPDAELTLDLVDGTNPALFRSGPDYSYLVMPLT
jgi:DNA polymerase-3 subunit beta